MLRCVQRQRSCLESVWKRERERESEGERENEGERKE